MNTPVKYVAEITDVREVTLLGTADLAFWKTQLQEHDLRPVNSDGKAQVFISAVDSKYMGIKFRELSVSVFVCLEEGGAKQDAVYLVQAFNSSRLFSFIERTLFHTPYCQAQVEIDSRLPASFHVIMDEGVILAAEMSSETTTSGRKPERSGPEGWEGPIFLPGKKPGKNDEGKLFFAKVGGHTQIYSFDSSTDVVTLKPSQGNPILQWLNDSHFAGQEWIIRQNATHARSKTVSRSSARILQAISVG